MTFCAKFMALRIRHHVPAQDGLSIPLVECFCGPHKDKLRASLFSPRRWDIGLLDMVFKKCMCDEHAKGVRDNSASLLSLLMFRPFSITKTTGCFHE